MVLKLALMELLFIKNNIMEYNIETESMFFQNTNSGLTPSNQNADRGEKGNNMYGWIIFLSISSIVSSSIALHYALKYRYIKIWNPKKVSDSSD